MINVLLTGVGGQGTVLAAKVLAQTADDKGWPVRTAETIGMAQRGGSVVSHVRMGDDGAHPASPLVPCASADLVIAFEPAEAARVLPYCAPDGVIVCATSAVQPVTAALSKSPYRASDVLDRLAELLGERFVAVDDAPLLDRIGSRRALNTLLVATAVATGRIPISVDDVRAAVRACVKPRFISLNLAAIDIAVGASQEAHC